MNATKQLEDAVFYAATSLDDPALRRQFLDQACAGNASLRAAVEEMLSTQLESERFFAENGPGMALPRDGRSLSPDKAAEAQPPPDEPVGTYVGRFKLLQRIGEGGCGVVYMAEQDKPDQLKVAVKVIKLGMDTKSVIARFDAERQALALMDHPNIARVLDGGATPAGRPYFVMELVPGVKITDYCDQNHLDIRKRLELFICICHAVQHAHQKGVIHRDIKPSNILVTLHDGRPVPKVIDFGIAKATAGKLTNDTLFTPYEQFVGTPAYMSPEQAEMSGLDVDTRSDIYSLGVLLYELLTGRTPFDSTELMRSGLDELRRTLREKDPQRPSTILITLQGTELKATADRRHEEPSRLISLLKGDLDWIVMKALEKDRARRYETANGLAVDVQRYLDNQPVVARPPSRLYRFQKLVQRNRVVFAAGGIAALALLAGLGTSTWLLLREREAHREQARLRQQAQLAERRENELRRQEEAKAKINEAAIYVSQQRFEAANRLLGEVTTVPQRPSFDGVAAYRSVGEWLALRKDWRNAADRFYPLMQIDQLDDWRIVTLDYQACGVVLAECGDLKRYSQFCEAAISRFNATTNGDMAGRILKTCLLFPADDRLMRDLSAMADTADQYFAALPQDRFPSWAAIHLSLWEYRRGAFDAAAAWCERGGVRTGEPTALVATLQLILAMSEQRRGHAAAAKAQLDRARPVIELEFNGDLERGENTAGFWYDWLFARILSREAEASINGVESLGGD